MISDGNLEIKERTKSNERINMWLNISKYQPYKITITKCGIFKIQSIKTYNNNGIYCGKENQRSKHVPELFFDVISK